MDFSVCADCGGYSGGLDIRFEDFFLALTICGAVMLGHRMGRIARRAHLFPTVAAAVVFATAGAAAFVWILTSSAFLMLPFAGFLIGLFHQRASLLTLSLSAATRSVPGSE
jgi:hypothetical protein